MESPGIGEGAVESPEVRRAVESGEEEREGLERGEGPQALTRTETVGTEIWAKRERVRRPVPTRMSEALRVREYASSK